MDVRRLPEKEFQDSRLRPGKKLAKGRSARRSNAAKTREFRIGVILSA
jgi:hypothetical protein